MDGQKIFGLQKRCSCLQELFADVSKDMHACTNFVRTAKSSCRSAGTLFGRFKRHADLQKLCFDGEMYFHVSQQIGVGPEQNFTKHRRNERGFPSRADPGIMWTGVLE